MKNVFQISMAFVCGGVLLLSSCAKETVTPQPATPLSSFAYQNRTVEELIQAASPELYADLLEQAQNSRAPIIKTIPGTFVPGPNFPTTGGGTCRSRGTVCGIQIIDDRASGNDQIEAVASDIWTMAQEVSASIGPDQIIINEATPSVRAVRGINNISVNSDGDVSFTLVE